VEQLANFLRYKKVPLEGTFSQIVGVLSSGTGFLLLVIDFIGTATNPYPKRICFAFSDKDKETGKPITQKAAGLKSLMGRINFFTGP